MGEKKQAEKSRKKWTKVLAIVAGVLFVVLMVVSSMGMSWMTSLKSIQPGDVVVIDYTINTAQGNPAITTDQNLYKQLTASGYGILLSKQLTVTANQTLAKPIYPVQVYTTQSGWAPQYAIFASEYDAIGNEILGMKTNEKKTISLAQYSPEASFFSPDKMKQMGVNISSIKVGDVLPMGVSDNPNAAQENTTANTYMRLGEITSVTPDGALIDIGTPSIEISITTINKG